MAKIIGFFVLTALGGVLSFDCIVSRELEKGLVLLPALLALVVTLYYDVIEPEIG